LAEGRIQHQWRHGALQKAVVGCVFTDLGELHQGGRKGQAKKLILAAGFGHLSARFVDQAYRIIAAHAQLESLGT